MFGHDKENKKKVEAAAQQQTTQTTQVITAAFRIRMNRFIPIKPLTKIKHKARMAATATPITAPIQLRRAASRPRRKRSIPA